MEPSEPRRLCGLNGRRYPVQTGVGRGAAGGLIKDLPAVFKTWEQM